LPSAYEGTAEWPRHLLAPVRTTATFPHSYALRISFSSNRRDYLDLYFAGSPVAWLECHVFGYVFGHIVDDINDVTVPLLVYVDHGEISRFREASVRLPARGIPNWRLRQATLARLQPPNITWDSYLVGILIALAQAQYVYIKALCSQIFADQEAGSSRRHEPRKPSFSPTLHCHHLCYLFPQIRTAIRVLRQFPHYTIHPRPVSTRFPPQIRDCCVGGSPHEKETPKRVVGYYGAGRMQAEEEAEGRHIIAQEANADVFVCQTGA
jgi:hypothetical protein